MTDRSRAALRLAEASDYPRLLRDIQTLADDEKDALGFLPFQVFDEAVQQKRLLALCTTQGKLAGYLLFGGVYPNARVVQLATEPTFRGTGVASMLLQHLVLRLERNGYLSITARVAHDLTTAQSVYERNGFVARDVQQGGVARKRNIVVRVKDLATPSLFPQSSPEVHRRTGFPAPFHAGRSPIAPRYAIDVNVLLDLARDRSRTAMAEQLFKACLDHRIRLVATEELSQELRRTSPGLDDPLLRLAMQLPELPAADSTELRRMATSIHTVVFKGVASGGASNVHAVSDCRHLAHAALASAAGYITSDKALIAARSQLLLDFGIDVASLEDLIELLPTAPRSSAPKVGKDYSIRPATLAGALRFLHLQGVPKSLTDQFSRDGTAASAVEIGDEAGIAAVRCTSTSRNIHEPVQLLVHVRHQHPNADLFSEHLIDTACRDACSSGPCSLQLTVAAGQDHVLRAACLQGFVGASAGSLNKVALGRPITARSWAAAARQLQRTFGWDFEGNPLIDSAARDLRITAKGTSIVMSLLDFERHVGPTLVYWTGRPSVLTPIGKAYADDLLGTSNQLPLLQEKDASIAFERCYLNTPRAAGSLVPGAAIFFYESSRTGGRGAVVAVASVIESAIHKKNSVPSSTLRRVVVDDVNQLSESESVLVTTFSTPVVLPKPIALADLRAMGAGANFQTATKLAPDVAVKLLDQAWNHG